MLAKRKAISECKKFWNAIKKSGLSKKDFLRTEEGKLWRAKEYRGDCPLCEYDYQRKGKCSFCPLILKYKKDCYGFGYERGWIPSPEWLEAINGL